MSKELTVSILCEDQAKMGYKDKIFLAQHGLSVFIEADQRILFDTGSTDVFLHNAELLGVDVLSADWIVLSHGHWDHTDGLTHLPVDDKKPKMKLLVHPGAFVDRRKDTGQFNGMAYSQKEAEEKFDLTLSTDSYQITEHAWFLGEVPRNNDFESQKTAFFYMDNGRQRPDFLSDDSAMAIQTDQGLLVISGCSHAGICNIVEHAKKVTGQSRVQAVMGGFHLLGQADQLEKTIEYFRKNPVEHLYPMHCTDLPALAGFYDNFGVKKLCAGDVLHFKLP